MIRMLIYLVGITLLLEGCKMTGTVQIEVIKPAKQILPQTVNSLVLINNYKVHNNQPSNDEIVRAYETLDTLSSQAILEQLGYLLNESPRIDTCHWHQKIFFRKGEDILKPINQNHVALLCDKYRTTALLSLEGFGITDSIERSTFSWEGSTYTNSSWLTLYVKSVWRLYTLDSTTQNIERWYERDTIYLPEIQTYRDFFNTLNSENGRNWMASEICNKVAGNLSDKIAAYWQPESRIFFYSSNEAMQKAAQFAFNDEWLKAAAIWQPLEQNKDPWIAGAACHNMALVCEIQGKYELAKVWAIKALQKYNNTITINYLKTIDQRITEQEILNKQFWILNE